MPKVKIKYKKNPSQNIFHNDITSPLCMFTSGYGGGKTYALCMKMLKLSALNKDVAGGLLCPSFPEYKKDILPTFEQILMENGLLQYTTINKSDKYIIFPWTKAPMFIHTAEKAIKGPNYGYIGANEFSLMPFERIQELMSRLRVKDAPFRQMNFAGTPEDLHGWLEEFVEKQLEAKRLNLITGTTMDNIDNVSEEYIDHLRSTLDPQQLRLYLEGQMGTIGNNLFYYAFDREKNRTTETLNKNDTIYINVDFNVANMHATIAQQEWIDNQKHSNFVKEIVLKDASSDTYAMRDKLYQMFHDCIDRCVVTIDFSGKNRKTTGPSDLKVIKSVFKNTRYRAGGNPRLKKRQILVNGCLSHGYIKINKEECPVLWRDMTKVRQKDDFTKDGTNKDLTHASDTLDYYVDQEYNLRDRKSFNEYKAM